VENPLVSILNVCTGFLDWLVMLWINEASPGEVAIPAPNSPHYIFHSVDINDNQYSSVGVSGEFMGHISASYGTRLKNSKEVVLGGSDSKGL